MKTHDHTFKNLALDYARFTAEFVASAEIGELPPGTVITPIREELLKERLGDRFFEMDVPLKIEFPNGQRDAIVICFEQNTRNLKGVLLRHAVYCLQLAEMMETTRVIPVALYPFESAPVQDKLTLAADHGTYLEFRCVTVTLGSLDALKYLDSRNLVARLCLPLMHCKEKDKPRVVAKACEGLAELESDWDKRKKYIQFITDYGKLDKAQSAEMNEKYVERSPFREDIMSLYQVLTEEAQEKGKIEGKIEGILELYQNGVLTPKQARTQLRLLVVKGLVPAKLVQKALKQIS